MDEFIGKKVIVRSNQAGVFYGTLSKINGDVVIMENARKLFYWSGACCVEQISVDGVKNVDECKFTVYVKSIGIFGVVQILPCTENSISSLESVKEWKK